MPNYIHKFNNVADFNTAYNGNNYLEPWTSLTKNGFVESFTVTEVCDELPEEGTDYQMETLDIPQQYVFYRIRHDENGNTMYEYNGVGKGNGRSILIKTLNFETNDVIPVFWEGMGDFQYYMIEGRMKIGSVTIKDKVNYNKKQNSNNWVEVCTNGWDSNGDIPNFRILSVGSDFNNTVGESTYIFTPYIMITSAPFKGRPLDFICDMDDFILISQIDPNAYNGNYYRFVNNNNTWSIEFVQGAIG